MRLAEDSYLYSLDAGSTREGWVFSIHSDGEIWLTLHPETPRGTLWVRRDGFSQQKDVPYEEYVICRDSCTVAQGEL
jgi:hypothetical protein